jgi:hypothetical protein
MIDTFQTCEHCGQEFPSQSEKLVHTCGRSGLRLRRSTLEKGGVFIGLMLVLGGAIALFYFLNPATLR